MKWLSIVVLWTLVACYGADPAKYGTRTVAPRGCREPQLTYLRNNITNLNQLGLAAFRTQTDLAQAVDYEVLCDDFDEQCEFYHIMEACDMTRSGYINLGTRELHVDIARANGEFAFSGVVNHETGHLYISQGPHPDMAKLHICPCGVKAPECWAGGCGVAMMNPALAGLGTSTMTTWDGDTESIDVGMLAQNTPTDLDRKFFIEAMTP